jgi:parvulin-like peptidyl-prolyl isomerase
MKTWVPLGAVALTVRVGAADPPAPAKPGTPPKPAAQTDPKAPAPPKAPVTPAAQTAPVAPGAQPAPPKPAAPAKKLPLAITRIGQPASAVATVNGEAITMAQLMQQLVILGGPQVVDRMVQERIVRQEARKQGVVLSEKEIQEKVNQNMNEFKARFGTEARFQEYLQRQRRTPETFRAVMRPGVELNLLQEKLRDKLTASATVSDKEIADFYESQKALYMEPEMAKVSHILIAVTSADQGEEQKAKARAEEVLAKAKADEGKSFAQLAKEFSDDAETKEKGGEMVPVRRPSFYGITFDQAIFSGSPGVLPEVVRSIRGWHVLYLKEKTPSRQKSLEEVKETIQTQLVGRKRADLFRTHMQNAEKAARTDVKVQF